MSFKPNNIEPIHHQLVNYIKKQILAKKIALGSKLPAIREWSESLKVNPNTLNKALQALELENLIFTQSTIGKFVTDDQSLLKTLRTKVIEETIDAFIIQVKELDIDKNYLIERIEKIR